MHYNMAMNWESYSKYDYIDRKRIRRDSVENQLKRAVTLWQKLIKQSETYHANIFMPLYDIGMKMGILRCLRSNSPTPSFLEYDFSDHGYSASLKDITAKDDELGEMCCAAIGSLSATEIGDMDESFKIGHQFYAVDERLKDLHQRGWDVKSIIDWLLKKYADDNIKFDANTYEMMVILKVAGVDFYLKCERSSSTNRYFQLQLFLLIATDQTSVKQ